MEHTRISHYEIGRRLGRGGMGEVYEATDLHLDRRVALKFVAPEMAADAEALKRFEREARSAAALHHPHIATLFAFEHDGPRAFIAMELVGGESLRERIRRGPLPITEALANARDVAGALALAHRRGIAHRDVKPENLMFDEDGRIKLMDFGLARAAQASRITMTGSTLGTAAYMAPESTRGTTGPPADVFALGVVLHEMLTGDLPFAGDSPLALMFVIANEEPKPVRATRPEVSEEVAGLIARMLDKDPEARPDAVTVARQLALLTGVPPPPSDTVELEATRLPPADDALSLAPTVRMTRMQRRSRFYPLVALVAVLVLSVTLFGAWRNWRVRQHARAVALNNRGYESLQRDSLAAAQEQIEAALRADPSYPQAILNLAYTVRQAGDLTRAAALYGRVIREHPNDPALAGRAHDGLAEIDMRSSALPSAIDHWQHALALDSTAVGYWNNLAFALVSAGRTDEADRVLAGALRRYPGVAPLYKNAALAEFTRGEYAKALGLINQGLSIDRTMVAGWALRARIDARLGHLSDAHADRDRAAAIDPKAPDLADVDADIAAAEQSGAAGGHPPSVQGIKPPATPTPPGQPH